MKKVINALLLFMVASTLFSQNVNGKWVGKATLGNKQELTFVFDIENIDGVLHTTISIPSQQVKGLKPKQTTFLDGELIVDGSNLGIGYKGIYIEEKNQFNGKFMEGPSQIPLNLIKDDNGISTELSGNLQKNQEPIKPYPYSVEEVSFPNTQADIVLAGTLTKPAMGADFPAVVLISGSGPQDRDGTVFGHKTLLVLADYLTKQGISVLRFDDRGIGKSTGDFSSATTADFATDVQSAIEFLKSRNDINSTKIGLIGHSEGGIIAPLVANKMNKDVAFIIPLAGTAIPGSELSLIQSKTLRPFPVPDEAQYELAIRKAIAIASKEGSRDEIKKELLMHYEKEIIPILLEVTGSKEQANQIVNHFVENRTTPWSRFFYRYNPAEEYEKISCPVLALYGTKDTQVLADINAPAIEEALKKSKAKDYNVKIFPGLNHLFQEAQTGEMSEYQKLEQTFAPIALKEISTWITKVLSE